MVGLCLSVKLSVTDAQSEKMCVRVCACVFVNSGSQVDPCEQEPLKLTASTGTIYSPGYGTEDYPNNANCQWLIEAPAGNVRHT